MLSWLSATNAFRSMAARAQLVPQNASPDNEYFCRKLDGSWTVRTGQLTPYVSLYQIDLQATCPRSSYHVPSPPPVPPKELSSPEGAERHPQCGETKLPDSDTKGGCLEGQNDGFPRKKRLRRFNPSILRKLAPAPPRSRPNLYESPYLNDLPI